MLNCIKLEVKSKVRRGFTLLELIVVIVVLGILAMLAVPGFTNVKDKYADSVALRNASAIQRDFDAQVALGGLDNTVTPSAAGTWTINGAVYRYTATTNGVPTVCGTIAKTTVDGGCLPGQ